MHPLFHTLAQAQAHKNANMHTDVTLKHHNYYPFFLWVDIIPLISVSFHPSTSLIKRDKAMPSAIFITIKYAHTHTHSPVSLWPQLCSLQ